jgi:hypothetical protein
MQMRVSHESVLQVQRRCTFRTTNLRYFSSDSSELKLSQRQLADLEHNVIAHVASHVSDPVLKQPLQSLRWCEPRRLSFSKDLQSCTITLRLPSLLHPQLEALKLQVQEAAQIALQQWFQKQQSQQNDKVHAPIQVHVQVQPTQPLPIMARLVEDPTELLDRLGPGLSRVTHYVAVYSCKVRVYDEAQ